MYGDWSESDTKINAAIPSTLTGIKIGGIRNNMMTICLENWIDENSIDADVIIFEDFVKRDEAFYKHPYFCYDSKCL